jgi:hypothetical protein
MRPRRIAELKEAEDLLIRGFPVFVNAFSRKPAFDKPAQLATHLKTITMRRQAGSAKSALNNAEFVEALYQTLRAWGIGSRGSRLLAIGEFSASLRKHEAEIAALENASLDEEGLDIADISSRVWQLIRSVRVVDNKATLVPSTKALHHLLPDLVVPMDRAYTRPFFGWHEPEFQSHQARCFDHAFGAFHRVARAANPKQYVGPGWNTSLSKVIDNAVVGVFVLGKAFIDSQRSSG